MSPAEHLKIEWSQTIYNYYLDDWYDGKNNTSSDFVDLGLESLHFWVKATDKQKTVTEKGKGRVRNKF